jgi:transposase
MGEVSTIGLDIAKSVFQIHGVDVDGAVVIRKQVSRVKVLQFFAALPPCLVGIEACPTARASVRLGPDPRRALGPAAIRAASTGRTRDRTRPMLQQRQKALAKAPSTRDPNRSSPSFGHSPCQAG